MNPLLLIGLTGIIVLSSSNVALGQITGDATGLAPSGVVCQNLTTGQRLVSSAGSSGWDCGALGLEFSAGDRIQTGVRGTLPIAFPGSTFTLRKLPEDFVEHLAATDPDIDGGSLIADLDSDGDLDIVVAVKFAWFENAGGPEPKFVKHVLGADIALGEVHTPSVLDVNGDGHLDILASVPNPAIRNKLSWFRNDGADPPSFQQVRIDERDGWSIIRAKGANIDADGDMDFFAVMEQQDDCPCFTEIVWIENTRGGPPPRHVIVTVGRSVDRFWIVALDVDADQDPDLVVADNVDDVLSWYENDGASFTKQHVIMESYGVRRLVHADIDGDGDPDLVAVGADAPASDDVFRWFENDGDGAFTAHTLEAFPGHSFSEIGAADVSGDAKPDIVLSDFPDAAWLENDGDDPPGFEEHAIDLSTDLRFFGMGDLDQDGRVDLARASLDELIWYENRIGLRLAVTGLAVRDYLCHNRTSGQRLRIETAETAVDCENAGLVVDPGDEIEAFVRGAVE